MTDLLTTIITSPVAKKAGVPQPTPLRRYEPGAPVCEGPVLVTGTGPYAAQLREWAGQLGLGLAVAPVEGAGTADPTAGATSLNAPNEKVGAIVVDLSDATDPGDLAVLRTVAPSVKRLRPNGRVVVVGTDPAGLSDPAHVATQRALEGFVRSLGKELRAGATANHVLVRGEAWDGLRSAVEFFLSGRSAYVDGQVVRVNDAGGANSDILRPLEGKVALVTGAARGIGAEIAAVLARDGATIVAVDVPAAGESLARVANEIRGTALHLDVTSPDAGARMLEHTRSRYGRLDIVVHNAGITRDKLFVNMDESRWDSVLQVNLRSILRMNEAILRDDGLGEGGRMVCLASIAGIAGNRGQTNYGASKAGVIGLVTSTAAQVRDRGITVNAVAPGFIETDMTARIPFATREIGRRMNSLQQGGLPRDVAEAIAWLVQPGAAAVTGQVVRVCGQSLLGA
ncbi:MAG: 3-oxoacyl-ACP reductase [Intrasporangium sp.]|uniref:3-oxoacyl-ACP reductase n=1 Tax=Intrasporangium sp. TaxID=1925024 RepID=UPI002649AAFE|nr:3-oxoacyl-ACP reductase [Intrasporangium sp.]MDN5794950.1 3-oxoacyl-ACP reductase [Intrasporangium sp.]